MKKLLLLLTIMCVVVTATAEEIPYSKLLKTSESDLKEHKFKYNSKYNRHVLTKTNTLNTIGAFASALNGASADIKPHVDDYQIIVQNGKTKVSSVSMLFYSDNTYDGILSWFVDNGMQYTEKNLGKKSIKTIKTIDLTINIITEIVGQSTTVGSTSALAKTFDDSYFVYYYEILTDELPHSKWHIKARQKERERDAKGKKQNNALDLM